MKRRSYLATAIAGTALAGCMGMIPDESSDGSDGNADGGEGQADDSAEDVPDGDPVSTGTFDDFEDLEPWETIVGSLEADTDHAYAGSQSALIGTTEDEEQVRIRRQLSEPIDVRDVVPALALDTDSVGNPIIQLQDERGDYLQFKQHVREGHPFVRRNFGHTAVSGDPDLQSITEIHVGLWTGDAERSVRVDDFHFVPRVDQGRVLIQFQGGFESDYTLGYPVLSEYDIPASTFIATDRIRPHADATGDRLTEDQVAELADAGWTLGTVGARHRHLHEVDPDRLESDLLSPLEWFAERGYDDARYFGFPGGRFDGEMLEIVGEHYDLGFADRHRAHGYATNHLTLPRISGDVERRNLSAEQMIDALDWTAEYGGITTIVFYEMDEDDAENLEETAAHLADLRESGDLELVSPRELADEFVYEGD
ncbi:polysaccharide deacetylase family protein [Halopiger goleimassiliensis]|uniref:polysaccharide deacetylase family protein n=1 Tax=Halopiger goleimassiliensis TaxID=1293048 RepID=UPI0006778C7B|nr:polysaccharide deacetylase family protein [Halopiger goleimassiliensis]